MGHLPPLALRARAAAYAGKIPLCVWTPRLAEKLKAESGMKHHPLITGGTAEELTEAIDIADPCSVDGERCGERRKICSSLSCLMPRGGERDSRACEVVLATPDV